MEKIKTVNTSFKILQILICSICREIVIESDEVWKVEFAIDQIEKPGETVGNIIINNVIFVIIGVQVNEDLLDLNTTIQNLLGHKNYPNQSSFVRYKTVLLHYQKPKKKVKVLSVVM